MSASARLGTEASVAARIADLLRAELDLGDRPLPMETDLDAELLVDSLAKVELTMVIEDAFDIGMADRDVATITTLGELVDAVSTRVAARRARLDAAAG
ncbi:MAG: acyl carrier protein [Euzebyales bacterium]|jgi:acyl carrier protein|nr:acyl carrier protein [Euzebyales bacterium]